MTRDTPAPLFYPFETGDLAMPSADARAIWFGAAPGMRPPGNLRAALDCVQGFRPDYLSLQRAGLRVSPTASGEGYDFALVLAGPSRAERSVAGRGDRKEQAGRYAALRGGKTAA
jgi:16S rRNA (guanine1207-N2)-methyltransferase